MVARPITSTTSSMAPLALLKQLDQRDQQLSVLRQPVRQLRRSGVDAPETILYGLFIGGLSSLFNTRLIPQRGQESPPTFHYAWGTLLPAGKMGL